MKEYPATDSTEKNPRKERTQDYKPDVPKQKENIKSGSRDAKTPMRNIY